MFEIEHVKYFTFGRKTHIITDHKPLLPLFKNSLTNITTHLSRLLIHVSEYDVTLHCQPRSRMKLSDALSRQSNHSMDAGNKTEIKGLNISIHEVDTDILEQKLINIHEETQKDDAMQILIRHILEGWPESQENCPYSIKDFYSFHYELSVIDGLVLKGTNRIIVPEKLRQNASNKLHISYLGTSKTILRSRTCLPWPGINGDIKQLCDSCEIYNKFSARQPSESLKNDLVCT